MGVFTNAIIHELTQYPRFKGKPAKYLILSHEKEMLLAHECFESDQYKVDTKFDPDTGKKFKEFCGLEVVKVGIQYQGSIGWALGE